jgi:hypothetical protein
MQAQPTTPAILTVTIAALCSALRTEAIGPVYGQCNAVTAAGADGATSVARSLKAQQEKRDTDQGTLATAGRPPIAPENYQCNPVVPSNFCRTAQ